MATLSKFENVTDPAKLVPFVQQFYNKFLEIGLTLTLADIPTLIYNSSSANGGDTLIFNELIIDKLLADAKYQSMFDQGLSRNQILSMVNLPSGYQQRVWVMENALSGQKPAHLVQVSLLEIVGGVVRMKAGV